MNTTTVWLCGRWTEADEVPEINGIFSTEKKAVARCVDGYDYVAPFRMDEEQPVETCKMKGQYYPLPLEIE
ncbi:MAG: hypothetical protein IIB38_11520 [Candidatus Hydrogenedentes bacterium]|nr:hypothetical protein [Candidatus Hydrogenedentota bacterium]